jgi:hypothetical protein
MMKTTARCIILAGWGFTTAAIAIELPEQILACRTVADAMARAECYDRAVDALKPPAEIPDTLATTPREPPEPPEAPEAPEAQSSPTPSIAPTLSVAAEPAPKDPEAEVVELKQQVADLEQQVAILAEKENRAAETVSTTEPGSASVTPEDLFGKEETESRDAIRKLFGLRDVDQIEATLAEVKRTPYGKLVMVLDNGQIWTQIDTNRLRVKPGDGVRIKAARLGSFLLEKQTGSLLIRVKRVD